MSGETRMRYWRSPNGGPVSAWSGDISAEAIAALERSGDVEVTVTPIADADVIEQVAKALHAHSQTRDYGCRGRSWGALGDEGQEIFRNQARALATAGLLIPVDDLRPDSDVIERAARAYDPEAFEDHPIEQRRPLAAIQWGARRRLATEAAQRLAAAGLLAPACATWHTDPPTGWSTFGAHAFMDEVPALEFWGEEYGGDGLPIWERPVPAPDADQLSGIRSDGTNNEEGENR